MSVERKIVNENIKRSRDVLAQMVNTLDRIMDGKMTQTQAARELGITPQMFNNNINHNFIPFIRRNQILSEEHLLEFMTELESPCEALAKDIFGLHPSDKIYLMETEPQERFLEVIRNVLTPTEYKVMSLLYGLETEGVCTGKKSLREAGKVFGVTAERIRQIQAKALRKLRNPKYSRQLLSNFGKFAAAMEELNCLKKQCSLLESKYDSAISCIRWLSFQKSFTKEFEKISMKVLISDLPNFEESWVKELEEIGVRTVFDLAICLKKNPSYIQRKPFTDNDFRNRCQEFGTYNTHMEGLSVPIEEAGFSARTYRALHRNGIATIEELCKTDVVVLENIRGLGRKSLEEIYNVMKLKYKIEMPLYEE